MTLLTGAKQISLILGCSAKRVRYWATRGAPIRVVGVGRATRYLAVKEALVRWLDPR